jgi:hypothetical protein
MVESGNSLSRNPNICASCSSLADGMDDSSLGTIENQSVVEALLPDESSAASKARSEVPVPD